MKYPESLVAGGDLVQGLSLGLVESVVHNDDLRVARPSDQCRTESTQRRSSSHPRRATIPTVNAASSGSIEQRGDILTG